MEMLELVPKGIISILFSSESGSSFRCNVFIQLIFSHLITRFMNADINISISALVSISESSSSALLDDLSFLTAEYNALEE